MNSNEHREFMTKTSDFLNMLQKYPIKNRAQIMEEHQRDHLKN